MRLIDADVLFRRVGADCLNEQITLKEALILKKFIEEAPTVEAHHIKMELGEGLNICFCHVPSMMKTQEEER